MAGDPVADNPFYILGVPTTASRAEVERQAQKLIGMLEMGLKAAARYTTPLGPFPRTADLVRQAADELRDPSRRLLHELWAALPPEPLASPAPAVAEAPPSAALAPWSEALSALGWRPGA